jgi:class 3 adenylate cyclase
VVGFAGLGVVSELPEALAYQAANTMAKRAVLVGLIILFIAFWAGYLYSGTITRPIQMLVEAAQRIASGDFKINLSVKGRDEVSHLSRAFNEMALGLEERDRVKETFNKFHNKEIAEKLLSGEVKLGGERKEATVFFSDVRGFTAMSETMEPEQVVEMLNEYMTRMVAIIRSHHGIVDKYVGDAIMALWGVPLGNDDDIYNSVRACLAMRDELARLNELRISRGQSPLKIGMGLNIGPVIAGNIGSTEKMEYTVIGDTVNLASRMESMTKEYGTDFLIPSAIYERVKDRFIFERCKSARVKGKSAAIEIYKVLGYYDERGQEVIVQTPYSSYEAEKSDKVVHDSPTTEHTGLLMVDRTNTGILQLQPERTGEFSREITMKDMQSYFIEMYGEILGPFTEDELRNGIQAQEFPETARYAPSRDGEFKSIAEFGASALAEAVAQFEPPTPRVVTPPPFRHHDKLISPPIAPAAATPMPPAAPPAPPLAASEPVVSTPFPESEVVEITTETVAEPLKEESEKAVDPVEVILPELEDKPAA